MVQLGRQASQRGDEVPRSGVTGFLVWASSAARSSLSLGRLVAWCTDHLLQAGCIQSPPLLGL